MRAAAFISAALCAGLLLAACSAVPDLPPDVDSTTLRRFDGEPLRRRDILARRPTAIAVARALACIERGLREPWVENRDAAVVLDDAGKTAPDDIRTARNQWKLSELAPGGLRREAFAEYGFYAEVSPTNMLAGGVTPETLEGEVARILAEHTDKDDRAVLLAAWRRFSPLITMRRENYLASHWRFELGSARVAVIESLLGPHRRSHVLDTGGEFLGGATLMVDGYQMPESISALVAPGESSPVSAAIDRLAIGGRPPANVNIEGSKIHVGLSPEDREFLAAALKGLALGCAEVEYLPRGCTRFEVVLDYLVGNAEARATLGFARNPDGWTLDRFVYEPAAAAVVGRGGAALDLIEMLRHSSSATTVSGK